MRKCGLCLYLWALILSSFWSISNGYRNIRLEDYLCADKLIIKLQKPFRGDPTLTLRDGRESAAIISQVWNTTLPGIFSNKLRYNCEFRVQGDFPEGHPRGIYTIITHLKFRHDPVTGGCLDYIQFRNGNRSPSGRICNDISIDGPAGRLIFDQRDRDVSVLIHIDKRHAIHSPLELRMVLTAHSECKYAGDFLCKPEDPYSCISRHFVHDNITNCMFPCRDEGSCFHDAITSEETDTTKVALSAITALIFTMLGVGLCVWVCWIYWDCITVQQHAHEASATSGNHNRRELRDVPVIEPTAPTLNNVFTAGNEQPQQVALPLEDQEETPKDLPPSYESLFPNR